VVNQLADWCQISVPRISYQLLISQRGSVHAGNAG